MQSPYLVCSLDRILHINNNQVSMLPSCWVYCMNTQLSWLAHRYSIRVHISKHSPSRSRKVRISSAYSIIYYLQMIIKSPYLPSWRAMNTLLLISPKVLYQSLYLKRFPRGSCKVHISSAHFIEYRVLTLA